MDEETKAEFESFRKSYNLIIQSVKTRREELETRVAELEECYEKIEKALYKTVNLMDEIVDQMGKLDKQCRSNDDWIHEGGKELVKLVEWRERTEPDNNKRAPGKQLPRREG